MTEKKNFIVGWGQTKVLIINLKNGVKQELHINTEIFDKIYHLRFNSFQSEDGQHQFEFDGELQFECNVASKKKDINQICVYNLNDKHLFTEKATK